MSTIAKTIQDLEEQKKKIEEALRVLRGLNNGHGALTGVRNITPDGRRRIAEAQKRRWARERAAKKS